MQCERTPEEQQLVSTVMSDYTALINCLYELRRILNAFHETFTPIEPCHFPLEVWIQSSIVKLQTYLGQDVELPANSIDFLPNMRTLLAELLEAAVSKLDEPTPLELPNEES